MGWHPVSPMYRNFPKIGEDAFKNEFPPSHPCFGGWIKRGHETMKGTRKDKQHNVGGKSEPKRRHYTYYLAQNAKARGFLNGIQLKGVGKAAHQEAVAEKGQHAQEHSKGHKS